MQSVFDSISAFVEDVKQGAKDFAERSADVLEEMADWCRKQGGRLMAASPAPAAELAACRQELAECEHHCMGAMGAAAPTAAWDGSRVLNFIAAVKKLLDLFG